jgi:metal-dependent amidase/aminoacylase/carboxypeptidase family protein
VTRVGEETAREVFGERALEMMPPIVGGDDFSAHQRVVPGTFVFVGTENEVKVLTYSHHHLRFTIDEDALENGVKMHVNLAFGLFDKETIVLVAVSFATRTTTVGEQQRA